LLLAFGCGIAAGIAHERSLANPRFAPHIIQHIHGDKSLYHGE
jgi:hypothetical protein